MSERVTAQVNLSRPIVDESRGGEVIHTITIKEPTVKELRLADAAVKKLGGGEIELGRQLVAQCSGLLPAVLDKLTLDDFTAAMRALGTLMPKPAGEGAGEASQSF